MKTLKLIIVCLALLAGKELWAQNLIVDNNSHMTNGNATFTFASSCPTSVLFQGYTFGNSVPSPLCGALVSVSVTFDDPGCTSNPTQAFTLTPFSSVSYTECRGFITYTISVLQVGVDWVVDIQ